MIRCSKVKPYLGMVITVFVLIVLTAFLSNNLPTYGDEEVYVEAGLTYIRGVPPYSTNFEHPPLAKYIIGLFALIELYKLAPLTSGVLSLIATYRLSELLLSNYMLSMTITVLVALDTLFINCMRFALLDPIMVCITLWAIYYNMLYLRGRHFPNLVMSQVLWGAALASKLSSLYVFIPTQIYLIIKLLRGRKCLDVVTALALTALAYLSTFLADILSGGPQAIVEHNLRMINYMLYRHGFSLPLAVNGFLTLAAKISLWYHYTLGTVVIRNVTSYEVIPSTQYLGRYVEVCWGLGSPLWYLFIPSTLYLVVNTLTNGGLGGDVWVAFLPALTGSLTSIIHGNIEWYYLLPLPLLYIALLTSFKPLAQRFGLKFLTLLIVIQASYLLAVLLGIIPWRVGYIFS